MIRSMTGYARGTAEAPGHRVSVELRSLNGRFAEVRIRASEPFATLEPDFRRRVLRSVRRGRVELDVRLAREDGAAHPVALDLPFARDVVEAARRLRFDLGVEGELDLASLLRVPGVLRAPSEDGLDASVRAAAERALEEALAMLEGERVREGEALRADLLGRFERMLDLAARVRERASDVPATLRDRLRDRVAALAADAGVDPTRLAQEAAFLADRADVTEEVVRLVGHLGQAVHLLRAGDGEPVGKRLDFLLQEIHRETNTIGSKSPDLELTRLVLDLKSETEKVREQVQNLE
jgi:uncharacterized protein (TIGR00255 family)